MMSCFGKQLSWLPGNNQTQTHPEMLRGDKDVLSPTLVESSHPACVSTANVRLSADVVSVLRWF